MKQNCTNLEMQPIFKIWPILIINKLIPIQFAHRIRINPPHPPPQKKKEWPEKLWKYNVYRKVYLWSLYEFILYNIDFPVPLKDSYNRTKKLLLRKKDKLTKLAEMLMKYETLDMEEIRLIMEGKDIVRSWLWAWL